MLLTRGLGKTNAESFIVTNGLGRAGTVVTEAITGGPSGNSLSHPSTNNDEDAIMAVILAFVEMKAR